MRKRIRPVRADDEAKGETEGGGRRLDWALQVINTTQATLGQYEASARDWRSSLLLALGGMGRDRSAEAQVAQLRGGSRPDDIPAARISRITDLVVMDRFFTALNNATGNKTKTKRCSSLVLRSWLVSKRILKSKAAPVAELFRLAWLPRALSDPGNANQIHPSVTGRRTTPQLEFAHATDQKLLRQSANVGHPTAFYVGNFHHLGGHRLALHSAAGAIPSIPTSKT